ncbi:MAG: rRNA maturation RNase YbeY [Candidatus Moranbacteria bacterium]|nr:rRNA maturation RNase YbeY [Candidatus Moranbacteria bacterium]NTW46190.1 rRNA maturation RNase YbeY [Candidatus Moranbacteria bacterium]
MNVEADIVRSAECDADDAFFRAVAERTVSLPGTPSFRISPGLVSVGIALVSDDEIAALNATYRGKESSTDVLSFAEFEGREIVPDDEGNVFLGDLVVSPAFVSRAAAEDGVPFRRELAFVVSHGILHLLGFDHGEEMFRLQDEATDAVAGAKSVV